MFDYVLLCPNCGQDTLEEEVEYYYGSHLIGYHCENCGVMIHPEDAIVKRKEEENEDVKVSSM